MDVTVWISKAGFSMTSPRLVYLAIIRDLCRASLERQQDLTVADLLAAIEAALNEAELPAEATSTVRIGG